LRDINSQCQTQGNTDNDELRILLTSCTNSSYREGKEMQVPGPASFEQIVGGQRDQQKDCAHPEMALPDAFSPFSDAAESILHGLRLHGLDAALCVRLQRGI
jgi:hypothetical protein